MTKAKSAEIQMRHNLDKIEGLVELLQQEPWGEYDPVLTAACNLLVKQAYEYLQKTAKAISHITPAESRDEAAWSAAATQRIVSAEPWYEGVLDRMQ